MEFTIGAEALLQGLKQINVGLASFPQTLAPDVLLCAKDGKVTATVYCRSLHICDDLGTAIDIAQEGEYAADHRRLQEVLRAFQGLVTVKLHEPNIAISTKTHGLQQIPVPGNARQDPLQVRPLPAEAGATFTRSEYVAGTCQECGRPHGSRKAHTYQILRVATERVQLRQQDFARLVGQTSWLAPLSDYGDYLQEAVYLAVKGDQLTLAACDNDCAALATQFVAGAGSWERGVLLPARQLARANKALPKDEQVQVEVIAIEQRLVRVDDQDVQDAPPLERLLAVRLSAGNVTATLVPMEITIPDYRSLFPVGHQARVGCASGELLQALKVLTPVSLYPEMSLHLDAHLKLTVEQKPVPAQREIALLEREGPACTITLNALYLQGALKAATSPQVTLELSHLESEAERKPLLQVRERGDESSYTCAILLKRARIEA
jgi:DNA polymerase III sliding clamp (beta) subunit (PCNA family)